VNGLIIQRVQRDEKMIKELNEAADKFIEEMWEMIEKVRA